MSVDLVLRDYRADEPEPRIDPQSIDYALRQRIVIVEDEIAFAGRRIAMEAERGGEEAVRKSAEAIVAGNETDEQFRMVLLLLPLATLAPGPALLRVGASLAPIVGNKVVDLVKKARRERLRVLPVALSEARELRFPGGDPVEEMLYVGNPVSPRDYYPAASFHRRTFEHKFHELVRLLGALGATEIGVKAVKGYKWNAGIESDVPGGKLPGKAAVKSKLKRLATTELDASFSLTPAAPKVPSDLRWLDREDGWRTLVELQLDRRVRDYSLNLRLDDNFGMDAEISARVKDLKIGLGGSFEEHHSTVWQIHAAFGEVDDVAGRIRP
jgi:hypothetical protein